MPSEQIRPWQLLPGAEPTLRCDDSPEDNFLPDAEEGGENEDRQRDRAEDQTERCAANSVMFRRFLEQGIRQTQPRRQSLWRKISNIEPDRKKRRRDNENEPRQVCAIDDAHRSVGVMRFVARRHRRPSLADKLALRRDRVAEKSLRIDPVGGVVRTSVDAARRGKLRAKVAGVRFVSGYFLFLDLDLRG